MKKVKEYIDDLKPVGADLTVGTAEEIAINVSCKIEMTGNVTENIKKNISEYLTEISFSKGYAKIGQAILNTDGVIDYTNLTVNQSTNNVPITETQIAVLGVLKID